MMRKYLLRWEVIVGAAVLFGLAFIGTRVFLYDWFRIPSSSMHPTIPEGSFILVEKWGYGNYGAYGFIPFQTASTGSIERGDIVVFRLPTDPDIYYVKRVIGLPGDRVEYVDRRLRINGFEAALTMGEREGMYQYATETIDGRQATLSFIPERHARNVETTVPEDHIFMLGDSRDNARDSRFEDVGFVPRQNVIGIHVKTWAITPSR
jgi:signal peptidase I